MYLWLMDEAEIGRGGKEVAADRERNSTHSF